MHMSLLLSLPSRSRTLNANTSAPYLPTWWIGYHRLNIIAYYLLVCMCLFCVVGVCVCVSLSLSLCCLLSRWGNVCIFIIVFAAAAAISARAFLPSFLPSLQKKLTPISCFLCCSFSTIWKKKKEKKSLLYEQSLVQRRPIKQNWDE